MLRNSIQSNKCDRLRYTEAKIRLRIYDIFSVFKIENSCDLLVVTSAEEKLIKQ